MITYYLLIGAAQPVMLVVPSCRYFSQLMDLFVPPTPPVVLSPSSSSGADLSAIEEEDTDDNVFTVSPSTPLSDLSPTFLFPFFFLSFPFIFLSAFLSPSSPSLSLSLLSLPPSLPPFSLPPSLPPSSPPSLPPSLPPSSLSPLTG